MPTPTSLRSFWINWPCARRPGRMTLPRIAGSNTSGPAHWTPAQDPSAPADASLALARSTFSCIPRICRALLPWEPSSYPRCWEYFILASGFPAGRSTSCLPGRCESVCTSVGMWRECVTTAPQGGRGHRRSSMWAIWTASGPGSRTAGGLSSVSSWPSGPLPVLAGRADVDLLVAPGLRRSSFFPMALLAMVIHDSSSISIRCFCWAQLRVSSARMSVYLLAVPGAWQFVLVWERSCCWKGTGSRDAGAPGYPDRQLHGPDPGPSPGTILLALQERLNWDV